MSIEHKVQNETGRNPYRIGANVLLLVAFFLLFHPLLSRGSLMYQPTISHWLTEAHLYRWCCVRGAATTRLRKITRGCTRRFC